MHIRTAARVPASLALLLVASTLALAGPSAAATPPSSPAPASSPGSVSPIPATPLGFGDNGSGESSLPTLPAGASHFTAVAAGRYSSLALTDDGQIVGFGDNTHHQRTIPALPAGATAYTAISAGRYSSLALTDTGKIVGFGENTNFRNHAPALPEGATAYTAISAGGYHSLALTDDGQIVGFGNNTSQQSTAPALPAGATAYTAISAGGYHSLALTDTGQIVGFGSDAFQQTIIPALPAGATAYTAISAGGTHSLALTDTGQIVGFGSDAFQQSLIPALPAGATAYTAISAGDSHSLALTDTGQIVGFGSNTSRQAVPGWQPGTTTAIAAGNTHSLALYGTFRTQSAGDPIVTGTPAVGLPLHATPGATHDADVRVSYQWQVWGADVAGATGATFTPRAEDLNKSVRVVTKHVLRGHTTATRTSRQTDPVALRTFPEYTLSIIGTPQLGSVLTSSLEHDAAYTYQWKSDGEAIPGADRRSFTPNASHVGTILTLEVTASAAEHSDKTYTASTTEVAPGLFTDVSLTLAGDTHVGGTLTAVTSGQPTGTWSFVWRADGAVIADATGRELILSPSLHGTAVTVEATLSQHGYTPIPTTSDPVTVSAGTQTGTRPTITGTPSVDETLTAATTTPPGATVAWQWFADAEPVSGATSTTLTLTPALVGTRITVRTTTSRGGYDPLALSSAATGAVTKSEIRTAATSVSGTAKVGETLAASAASTPAATATHQWTRGTTVLGTGSTYTPVSTDIGQVITLTTTFTRDGYSTTTATATTPAIATDQAPTLTLTAGATQFRQGRGTVLAWNSTDATRLTTSWGTGTGAPAGTHRVEPPVGRHTYTVTATNENGSVTATVTLDVALPAKALTVRSTKKKVRAGKKFTVVVTGLAVGERLTLKYGKKTIKRSAGKNGGARITLTATAKKKATRTTLRATGSFTDRTGTTRITLLPKKR